VVDGKKDAGERLRAIQINRAAMVAMTRLKHQGKLILVFPAGTRYRPWDPASKRGVREIDSYIKNFDYMCLVAGNGHLLKIQKGDMLEDYVEKDVVWFTSSPVLSCAEFRARAKAEAEAASVSDVKQAIVDALMARLDIMHNEAEQHRLALITKENIKT
jgi:glycerol-3-phosphate O-acyltransferase